ncbi:prolyl aminopeptidase [Mycoplasmopsis gallinarum]|uniref:Proline iminopeptidase n=1 Tax=Mycoplasmopsis gallinarum TaxID=29557 RepID=A0A168RDT7_9BACT|nr:prolyl aminopeptidase [Mycoplasmopsis gallinarum]OAB48880.1 Proline iminopeptidase [Mycoplasmopsis gallinarum]
MQTYLKYLYPHLEPYETGYLATNSVHKIYYEISGNPKGKPIVYVHGGPGGGTSPISRRFFNPKKYKIVVFDQRGCGKSIPKLNLENNTTQDLVEDLENLRKHLSLKQVILFGGSWGTTLSLCYALKYPENVSHLILRGIFLARQSDVDWLYQEGASYLKPTEYERYKNVVLKNNLNPENLVASYHELMHHSNKAIREEALIEWTRWESALISVNKYKFKVDNLDAISEISLIENHFFYHQTFIPENYILDNINKIQHIPTYIVHGEYDLDCRPSGAYELHKSMPNSKLYLLPKTAHTQREYLIAKTLVKITDEI